MAVLNGTAGNDKLTGGALNDTLNGLAGNDTLAGSGGSDILNGGSGNDSLTGGAGNDRLNGGAGTDKMLGGSGNDTYVVNSAADVVDEGGNNDSSDRIQASISISLSNYDDIENATLLGTKDLTLMGDDSANILAGNAGSNTIAGGSGDDTLSGRGGDDLLVGGGGDDLLTGGGGNDRLFGGNGDDRMRGEAGDDFFFGGVGDDVITGGTGSDTFQLTSSALAEDEFLYLDGDLAGGGIDKFVGTWDDGATDGLDTGDEVIDISDLIEPDDALDIDNFISFVSDGNGGQFYFIDVDGADPAFHPVPFLHFIDDSGQVGFLADGFYREI